MTSDERWNFISDVVERRTFVSVNELSQLCRVSEVTIRRDLQALHSQGRLQRAYGGAAALAPAAPSLPSPLAGATGAKPSGFLAGRYDALIAPPITPNLERILLDRSTSHRIPIIAESLGMQGAQTVVAVDNHRAAHDLGRWAGDYARTHLDGVACVLDLTHHLSNTHARSHGFIAGLRAVIPEAQVTLSIDAQAHFDTAWQLTRDALAVHPTINIIFAINDITAAGAIKACEEAGIASERMLVLTFGLEGDTLKEALMAGGYCKAGVAMFPEIVGPVCIEAASLARAAQPLPDHLVTPHAVLTAATLPDFYTRESGGWRLHWETVAARLQIPLPITPAAGRPSPRRIAFLVPFSEHEWYRNLAVAMIQHAAVRQIELEIIDAAESLQEEVSLRKRAIARRAAAMIQPGDVILIDDGEVTGCLAEAMSGCEGVTAITNSVAVFDRLRHNPAITLISTGGLLRSGRQALIGPTAEATLRDLRADKLFLTTTGVSLDFGLSHPDLAEVAVKKAMIQAARQIILLADHSKFDADSVVQLAAIEAIDKLITDNALPASTRLDLGKRGVEIVLAET
jgi:DeoR/GlpR family transcriptional regulator of sugar metabolism